MVKLKLDFKKLPDKVALGLICSRSELIESHQLDRRFYINIKLNFCKSDDEFELICWYATRYADMNRREYQNYGAVKHIYITISIEIKPL